MRRMSFFIALTASVRSPRRLGMALAVLALLGALIVAVSPAEKTLGDTIRWVYVHVALTWTGMTALAVAGALGLALLVTGRPEWRGWMTTVGVLGLIFFALGMVTSVFAARATWGGMFWDEPRTRANLQVLAAGVIVAVSASWLGRPRWQGLLFVLLFAWMIVSLAAAPLVLHPRSPILSASSLAIPATFFSLYALSSLMAAAIAAHWQGRPAAS